MSLSVDINKNLTENAKKVLHRRYLMKDISGKVVETPQEMFERVSDNVAKADLNYNKDADTKKTAEEFYSVMTKLEFLPNSPTLMNAGKDLQQLSACFVLPIEDSMESIFETIKQTSLIHKSGGGTGFSFSRLRAKNATVRTTGGVASGPVSFLKVFDAATQAVKQGGTRRGANMGILRVDHPDILEFITCKEGDKEISNFNISIAITDEFMEKAEEGKEYDLIDPRTKEVVSRLNAREVFDLIVKMAWRNGEPGIIYIDKINAKNPTPKVGMVESTNPCGEQPLLPYESCNLGSINLSEMVEEGEINWSRLSRVVKTAVHFLDNVIDMNSFPIKEIEKMTKSNRKIGLGVMGFADMLIKLNISYNSEDAVAIADKTMKYIRDEAEKASVELAKERGVFPNFKGSIYDVPGGPRLRNATLTTIAPTGTLSIIAGASSGIEPLFALVYYKEVMDKDRLPEVNDEFKKMAKDWLFYSEDLMKKVAQTGSIQDLEEVPENIRKCFITSHDISPEWHIRIQAAFQKYTDNAVSKTINFPQEAKIADVRKAYALSYRLGCKGVTIYRDKSREEQVLNVGEAKPTQDVAKGKAGALSKNIIPKPRPTVVKGTTTKVGTGCGNLYVTINEDEDSHPFEVFMQMGKAGGCAASQLEAIGRLVSLAFRSGVDVKVIADQLRGIRCPSPSWEKGGRIFSCSDAIARVIEKCLCEKKIEVKEKVKAEIKVEVNSSNRVEGFDNYSGKNSLKLGNVVGVCPDCGGALRHIEGCQVCRACGHSKCG
ncbi:MAG: vitamin B12-dependent ribonucleotide reductase [Candidatus Omnitrophota bacterium]